MVYFVLYFYTQSLYAVSSAVVFLLASRRARHERAFLTAWFLRHVRRWAFARQAPYGGFGHYCRTFIDAAYNLRIHTVGDTYRYRMRDECIALACPEFVFAFAIFHNVILADKRLFGCETERTCRNGKHILAVECVNRDVGRQARFQFQVGVGSGYDNFVGDDRTCLLYTSDAADE